MNPLKLCLASPYALAGAHPVAEHVRGVATALAERGHRVTVLAPNSSTRALRSGRRRLRALAAGDHEALIALDGEPLQVAVAPAMPLRQRGRRRGVGLPVAARANVALAVGQGGFDIVHAFEPLLPGVATSALRHSPGLTVATFHAPDRALRYPVRGGTLERYRARIDALLATSAAGGRAGGGDLSRRLHRHPRGHRRRVRAGRTRTGPRVAVEWHGEGRAVVRTLVKLAASTPARRARARLEPAQPAAAAAVRAGAGARPRPRHEPRGRRGPRRRARRPPTCSSPAEGDDPSLAWEARACGCAVVAPLRAGALDLGAPGLGFAIDQPALAAAATARLLDDADLRAQQVRGGARGRRRAELRGRGRPGSSTSTRRSTRAAACTGARRWPSGR